MLLCGAGCCLWTRGLSGRRARPWGRAAWCARRRPAGRPRRELQSARRFIVRPHPAPHGAPRPTRPAAPPSDLSSAAAGPRSLRRPPYRWRSGFCSMRSWLLAYRQYVAVLMTPSPRLMALRPRCWLVWCPQCRPPWQTPVNTGCCRRGGPRCGHNSACRGVLLAREPLNMRVNPLIRTSTPQQAPGPGRPRTSHRANVQDVRPACRSSGPRTPSRTRVQVIRPTCAFKGPRAYGQADARSRRPERWQRCCRTGITEQWSLVLATGPTYWRP